MQYARPILTVYRAVLLFVTTGYQMVPTSSITTTRGNILATTLHIFQFMLTYAKIPPVDWKCTLSLCENLYFMIAIKLWNMSRFVCYNRCTC